MQPETVSARLPSAASDHTDVARFFLAMMPLSLTLPTVIRTLLKEELTLSKGTSTKTSRSPVSPQTKEDDHRLSEQEDAQEDAQEFEYHPVPPLRVVRIKGRIRTISVGQPMPYDLSGQD